MAQDAIVARVIPELRDLSPSETLRGIKHAETAVAGDLEATARDYKSLKAPDEKEKEEHVTTFFKHAAFCYRALALLFERKDFSNLAAIYRVHAEIYDDFLQGKINPTQFEKREKENEAAKLRALTLELAALEKNGPPKEGTVSSLEKLGNALGQVILVAAANELGDVPHVRAFNQGMMALERGDYANAARFLHPLAERGEARSQFWLGYFYRGGQGLPQNFSEALKWLQRAANQHEKNGQYLLGSMYFAGEGVTRDLVSAYMWFSLSASEGDDTAEKARDQIAPQMTPAQIAEAKKRASEWKSGKQLQENRTDMFSDSDGQQAADPLADRHSMDDGGAPAHVARSAVLYQHAVNLLQTLRVLTLRTIAYAMIFVPVFFGFLFVLFYSPCSTDSLIECLLRHNIVQGAFMSGGLMAFLIASQRTLWR